MHKNNACSKIVPLHPKLQAAKKDVVAGRAGLERAAGVDGVAPGSPRTTHDPRILECGVPITPAPAPTSGPRAPSRPAAPRTYSDPLAGRAHGSRRRVASAAPHRRPGAPRPPMPPPPPRSRRAARPLRLHFRPPPPPPPLHLLAPGPHIAHAQERAPPRDGGRARTRHFGTRARARARARFRSRGRGGLTCRSLTSLCAQQAPRTHRACAAALCVNERRRRPRADMILTWARACAVCFLLLLLILPSLHPIQLLGRDFPQT